MKADEVGRKDCKGIWPHCAAVAACPRRRGHRVSNCVVGSGGFELPCSIIAEHSVEGCDHFSHDGDDDDLGFLVGVGETIGEGLEGGIVSACAEGRHVEDITDWHPTTVDTAVSSELATIEVIWCEPTVFCVIRHDPRASHHSGRPRRPTGLLL